MCSIVDLPIPNNTCCNVIVMPSKVQIHDVIGNKYFIDDIYQGDIVEVVNRRIKVLIKNDDQFVNGSIIEFVFQKKCLYSLFKKIINNNANNRISKPILRTNRSKRN